MIVFHLTEYDISYTELVEWANESGAGVYAVASHGASDPRTRYMMEEKDMVVFKLRFRPKKESQDVGFYYCPYIPLMKI